MNQRLNFRSPFPQQRLWLVEQLRPGTAAYNVPFGIELSGDLSILALRHALNELVARHETLRTNFVSRQGTPLQVIQPPSPVELREVGASGLNSDELQSLLQREASRPFDLAAEPLIRTTLVRLGERKHILLLNLHHIICDEWSIPILFKDLGALYRLALQNETAALPPLELQYADYAQWQRESFTGDALEEQLKYWRERLAHSPPRLAFPSALPARRRSVRTRRA